MTETGERNPSHVLLTVVNLTKTTHHSPFPSQSQALQMASDMVATVAIS